MNEEYGGISKPTNEDVSLVLTVEEFEIAKDELEKPCGLLSDGCLCGVYSVKVRDDLYLSIGVSCRKSGNCPTGMNWIIDDRFEATNVELYDDCGGYIYDKGECEIMRLDECLNNAFRKIVRNSFIRDYSYDETDEYGNKPEIEDSTFSYSEYEEELFKGMRLRITVYKGSGKYYTHEDVEHKDDIQIWEDSYKEFLKENIPAIYSDGYIVVEDIGDNQSFHNALYKYEELFNDEKPYEKC